MIQHLLLKWYCTFNTISYEKTMKIKIKRTRSVSVKNILNQQNIKNET